MGGYTQARNSSTYSKLLYRLLFPSLQGKHSHLFRSCYIMENKLNHIISPVGALLEYTLRPLQAKHLYLKTNYPFRQKNNILD